MSKPVHFSFQDIKTIFTESYSLVFRRWRTVLLLTYFLIVIAGVGEYMAISGLKGISESGTQNTEPSILMTVIIAVLTIYLGLNFGISWLRVSYDETYKVPSFIPCDGIFWKFIGTICLIIAVAIPIAFLLALPSLVIGQYQSIGIILGLALGLGMQILYILLLCRLCLVMPILIHREDLGILACLKLSFKMSKGHLIKIFSLFLIISLPVFLVTGAFSFVRLTFFGIKMIGSIEALNVLGWVSSGVFIAAVSYLGLAVYVSSVSKLYQVIVEREQSAT